MHRVKQMALFFIKVYVWAAAMIRVPFFILFRWQSVPRNNFVYLCWHWSFGHTIGGLDYASRLYYPRRISVIYVPHEGSNHILPHCFAHNMDVFTYSHGLHPRSWQRFGAITYKVLRFYLLLWSALTGRFHFLERENIYQTISLAQDRLLQGNNEKGHLEKYIDWTGYVRLLHEGIGKSPQLPNVLDKQCRDVIKQNYPTFFEKPFVTILLREKGKGGIFDSSYRCAGPAENYVPAVRYLAQQGFHIVGTGETPHAYFKDIPGYFSLESAHISVELLNLFVLMNCCLFIGQQSGPHVILNSCRIPCLLVDAVPYRIGTFNAEDLILFKYFRLRETGRRLSLVEVFRDHLDLAFGYHFQKKNIDVEPNSAEEILEAVKEMAGRLRGKMDYTDEDKILRDIFRHLPSPEMGLYYHRNSTSLHILKQIKTELIQN